MKYETYREHLTELQLTINELRERIKKLEAQPGGDLIYRQQAVEAMYSIVDGCDRDDPYKENPHIDAVVDVLENLPPAQPELIEKVAYIRGFEQGRTQGMIDTKVEKLATNLQQTCNKLATDIISRADAIDAINSHFGFNIEEEYGSAVQEVINGLPSAQHKTTRDDVEEYCRRRNMVIITVELFKEMTKRWSRPEIILCEDCKHHHYNNDIPYCDRIDYGYGWKDNDFCSRAKRRPDE